MSLGSSFSAIVNRMVENLVTAGTPVVVAAGNDNDVSILYLVSHNPFVFHCFTASLPFHTFTRS